MGQHAGLGTPLSCTGKDIGSLQHGTSHRRERRARETEAVRLCLKEEEETVLRVFLSCSPVCLSGGPLIVTRGLPGLCHSSGHPSWRCARTMSTSCSG